VPASQSFPTWRRTILALPVPTASRKNSGNLVFQGGRTTGRSKWPKFSSRFSIKIHGCSGNLGGPIRYQLISGYREIASIPRNGRARSYARAPGQTLNISNPAVAQVRRISWVRRARPVGSGGEWPPQKHRSRPATCPVVPDQLIVSLAQFARARAGKPAPMLA